MWLLEKYPYKQGIDPVRTPVVPHSVLIRSRLGAMERKKNGQGRIRYRLEGVCSGATQRVGTGVYPQKAFFSSEQNFSDKNINKVVFILQSSYICSVPSVEGADILVKSVLTILSLIGISTVSWLRIIGKNAHVDVIYLSQGGKLYHLAWAIVYYSTRAVESLNKVIRNSSHAFSLCLNLT